MNISYSGWQVLLHWLSALVIIWTTVTGFYVGLFVVADELSKAVAGFNVALTTLFIPFFIVRCFFRIIRPVQHTSVDSRHPGVVRFVHNALYLVTAIVLLTGVLMMDRPIAVFSWFLIPQILHDAPLLAILGKVHVGACAALAVLIALHIGAVLTHLLAGRPVLKRMWFHN